MFGAIDKSWTLFLDRDGVINHRLIGDYVKSTAEFHLLDGVAEAIRLASETFGRIIVVTNQQGIGKGLMTERNLSEIHAYCLDMIQAAGGHIDRFYFAPELAAAGSSLRKPDTGMGLLAQQDFPEIDFNRSVMIGDSDSDIAFGRRLGMKTVYIDATGMEHNEADSTQRSLLDAIKTILA